LKGGHIHLFVRDLPEVLGWMDRVWQVRPSYQGKQMAVVPFGQIQLVLDTSEHDTVATLGFDTDNCDRDYRTVVDRGATSLEAPTDRPWGVRAAYIKGPAGLTFEIEQRLPER